MRRGTIRNVLTYIGRYKWLAFLSFVLAGVTVALTLLAPYLAGLAIDQIAEDGVHFDRLMSLLMQIALCVAATAAIQWVMNVVNNRVTFSVGARPARGRAAKDRDSARCPTSTPIRTARSSAASLPTRMRSPTGC